MMKYREIWEKQKHQEKAVCRFQKFFLSEFQFLKQICLNTESCEGCLQYCAAFVQMLNHDTNAQKKIEPWPTVPSKNLCKNHCLTRYQLNKRKDDFKAANIYTELWK